MDRKKGAVLGASLMVCALAGAGLEHVRQRWLATVEEAPVEADVAEVKPERPKVVTVRDESAVREAAALRKRVAELEEALSARSAERAQVTQPPKEEPVSEERPRRQSWEDRMAQMKKENPEQYAEMQKRREEFRQNIEQRVRDRADFLDAIDVKSMTATQRENHEKLLATVTRVNELMAQMGTPGAENTHELRREMGESMATLGELYGEERRFLFEETAKAVGYQGAEATAFAEQMQTIIDNTTMMPGPGFGRRGGGERGGPPAQ